MQQEPKDYYAILELPPSADAGALRKAYRRLAHLYHPDKTQNDPYANAKFNAIKEAYEILTDPRKKEQYLQQRWYQQSTGRKMAPGEAITPPLLLQYALELNRYVSTLDVHRMDHEGLTEKILSLLHPDNLKAVHAFQEPETLQQVFSVLTGCTTSLRSGQLEQIRPAMIKLVQDDPSATAAYERLIRTHKTRETREKWAPWIVLLISVIGILLIFILAR